MYRDSVIIKLFKVVAGEEGDVKDVMNVTWAGFFILFYQFFLFFSDTFMPVQIVSFLNVFYWLMLFSIIANEVWGFLSLFHFGFMVYITFEVFDMDGRDMCDDCWLYIYVCLSSSCILLPLSTLPHILPQLTKS
jgi:hypothetical protein